MKTPRNWNRRCLSRRPTAPNATEESTMRYLLLWILGVPIPVLILIWLLWGH